MIHNLFIYIVPRKVLVSDFSIENISIPEGSIICFSPYVLHHNEKVY